MNIMKKLLIGATIAFFSTTFAHAGKFNDAVVRASKKIGGNGQKTVVLFHTDKSPKVVLSQVRNAMRVRDPGALFYPYWVTKIHHEEVVGKCGFIIGEWWTDNRGDGAGNWEPRVFNKVENSVNLIAFGYYYDDITDARETDDALSATGKDVINACES